MSIETIAEKIVKAIEADFTDRRGLRQQWEEIDDETQDSIRKTWKAKIVKILRRREWQ